ncbi:MAG: phage head morphogenesis protein [Elusimicrobiota bacterium]|jgi:hypothetical protein|nr:phage head morphogenesis protein [Elusimicrobiota bacterium]
MIDKFVEMVLNKLFKKKIIDSKGSVNKKVLATAVKSTSIKNVVLKKDIKKSVYDVAKLYSEKIREADKEFKEVIEGLEYLEGKEKNIEKKEKDTNFLYFAVMQDMKEIVKGLGNNDLVERFQKDLKIISTNEQGDQEKIDKSLVKSFVEKYANEIKNLETKQKQAVYEEIKEQKLLKQRLEMAVRYDMSQDIKKEHKGEWYIWVESTAENPDPDHKKNWGKKFKVGEGEMPGERYGCRCDIKLI